MVNMDEHEGWKVLSRAMLHLWQLPQPSAWTDHDARILSLGILDYCRRLLLMEQYPDNKFIAGLVAESAAKMAQQAF